MSQSYQEFRASNSGHKKEVLLKNEEVTSSSTNSFILHRQKNPDVLPEVSNAQENPSSTGKSNQKQKVNSFVKINKLIAIEK